MDDKSIHFGKGAQCITTGNDVVLPMVFINGLPYLKTPLFTDDEWNTLPHVHLTSDLDWDPIQADKNGIELTFMMSQHRVTSR